MTVVELRTGAKSRDGELSSDELFSGELSSDELSLLPPSGNCPVDSRGGGTEQELSSNERSGDDLSSEELSKRS
jgi:hypothetical protein